MCGLLAAAVASITMVPWYVRLDWPARGLGSYLSMDGSHLVLHSPPPINLDVP